MLFNNSLKCSWCKFSVPSDYFRSLFFRTPCI